MDEIKKTDFAFLSAKDSVHMSNWTYATIARKLELMGEFEDAENMILNDYVATWFSHRENCDLGWAPRDWYQIAPLKAICHEYMVLLLEEKTIPIDVTMVHYSESTFDEYTIYIGCGINKYDDIVIIHAVEPEAPSYCGKYDLLDYKTGLIARTLRMIKHVNAK